MIEMYIGRVVTFVVTPVLLVAVPVATNAINSVLGTGLSDQQVTNYAIATAIGLAAVIYKWLQNRGEWEKVQEVVKAGINLHDEGAKIPR